MRWQRDRDRVKKFPISLLILTALAAWGGAWAATCSTSATGVAFGSYDRLGALPLDSTGTVTVICNSLLGLGLEAVNYQIRLSAGGSGSFTARRMSSGGNTLNYNLYTDSAHLSVWGDGTGATSISTDGYSFNLLSGPKTKNYTVYGRMSVGQNVPAGAYSDSITVTVSY